ncbi:MAG: NfeD family protein [Leptospira sp.]|nr:NfeD family protein [Leptospira sp.]
MELILQNAAFSWVVFGIILLVSEFLIPGTFIIFLGIGAIITGITTRVFEISFSYQILLWVLTSGVLIAVGGAFLKKFFRSESSVDPFVKDDYIGQIVPVETDILVERLGGKVRFQGTVWDAISTKDRISKGDYVRILSRDNLTFTVERVES